MRTYVEQQDLLFCNLEYQGNPVAVCEADGLYTGECAGEGVQFEAGLEWVLAELVQGLAQNRSEIGVLAEKLADAALEMSGCDW